MIDLRLLPPALAAWLGGAAAISLPAGWWLTVTLWSAALATATAAVLLRLGMLRQPLVTSRQRWALVASAVSVAAAAAALVATSAVFAMPARHPDAVGALAHHALEVRADVTSLPQTSPGNAMHDGGVRFSATVGAISAGSTRLSARMPVLVFAPAGTDLKIGDGVIVRGTMTMLPSYSATAALMYASARPRVVSAPAAMLEAANVMRSRFSATALALPGDGGDLLPGLAIGDVHALPAGLSDDMKQASLTHLTAVSGANCAVVVFLVGAAAGAVGLGRGIRAFASLTALVGFVVLVTPQPSVLRAAVMATVIVIGGWVGGRGRALSALSLAIIGLLAVDPWLAVDYGFALSVLATGALLLLAPRLSQRLAAWMPSRVAALLAVPIAAQVACQPVLLMLNPTVPLYGVLANLAAEPAAPIATVLGLLACLVLPFWGAAGSLLAHLAWLPSAWIAAVARVAAALPGSGMTWFGGAFGVVLMIVATVAIVLVVVRPARRITRAARAIALASAVIITLWSLAGVAGARVAEAVERPNNWTIAACDIGQGDAVLVQSRGIRALVDTGPDPDLLSACLRELGVGRIDLLVLTHYDLDHVGGTSAVVGKVGVALVGPPTDPRGGRLDAQLQRGGAHVHHAQTGDSGRLGALSWQVLWPDADPHGMEPGNEQSVTVLFTGDGLRALFLGDFDERAQDALLSTGRVPSVDVVKVAHHGSRDQSASLYQHLHARVGLISCGAGNDYGHPTSTALGIMARAGTEVMRTDVQGMLMVTSDAHGALRTWTQRHATDAQLARPG
jgi:competence protein ComEC